MLHLQRAEIYIFLEYYILAEGQIWDRIFHVLRERAAAGVEVRIIFDDFGNLTRFSDASLQALQDAGVEVEVFNPVHRYVNRIYFNYRDHRKIAVIDGVHAYTGGINIADEYANLFVRFGHWKDTGVRIDGAGAWGFASQFIQMWKMIGRSLEVALVGSTNMDYRTFQLHYECAVLLYHMPAVEDLLEDMDRMVAQSAPYTLAEWNQRSWLRKMCASLLRLVAIWF